MTISNSELPGSRTATPFPARTDSRAGRRQWSNRALHLLVATLTFVGLIGILAGPAGAHAVLEASHPDRGAVLKTAPGSVTFTFNEPIEAGLGAVRVYDSDGDIVQDGDLAPADGGRVVGVSLPATLAPGLYTAIYRVVSADSHPVSGGITFSIEADGREAPPPKAGKTISELLASTDSGPVTEAGFWAMRWIGFIAIALSVGTLIWLVFIWQAGRFGNEVTEADLKRRFRRILAITGGVGVLVSLAAVCFQGAVASGGSFWSALNGGTLGDVAGTRYGTVMLVRSVAFLALVGFGVVGRFHDRKRFSPAVLVALAAGVVLLITPGLAGHAATRDPIWLLLPSDFLHVSAMVIWTGGLASILLLVPLVSRRLPSAERTAILHHSLTRFSPVALAAVIVIAATGTLQAILEVGSFSALIDTAFGRAVTIKILLFIALILIGWLNRSQLIPALAKHLGTGNGPGDLAVKARFNLRAELGLIALVLAATAALISYPPPDTLAGGPISGGFSAGDVQVEYTVDPARPGGNESHIYLFDSTTGAPRNPRSMELAFDPPTEGETPIEARISKAGPGHYVAPRVDLAIRGRWTGIVRIRLSRFDEETQTFPVEIR